jgi:uncharacterized caspase-like protein
MRTALLLLLGLLFCLTANPAMAEKRVALVIGMSKYQQVPRLANPARDAAAMTDLFKKAGFDVVDSERDLGISDLRRVVREFAEVARTADIAVVYYAGHGMEVNGTNYLIPTDAKLLSDFDIEDETISLDRVLHALDPVKRLKLVILDACRDNPFSKTMKRSIASRSIGRGLAEIEPTSSDTLVAFAAKAGAVASDGDGYNSPFATALVKYITEPGLDLRLAFGRVRDDVLKITGNRQEPFVYGSLGGETMALVPAVAAALSSSGSPDLNSAVRQDYSLAERIGTKPVWDSFIAEYPSGFYSDLAKSQRDKLGLATNAAPSNGKNVADEKARVIDESAKAEEKNGPGEKSTDQITALTPTGESAVANDLSRLLEIELQRVGCNTGAVDGNWNTEARRSMQLFNQNAGTQLDLKVASIEALDVVRGKASRICPLICDDGYRVDGDRCTKIECHTGYRSSDGGTCERIEIQKSPKPIASVAPSNVHAPHPYGPKGYQPMGSGKVSDGNCQCKSTCNKFASMGQLSGSKVGQCKSNCEQKYSGCNRGALR